MDKRRGCKTRRRRSCWEGAVGWWVKPPAILLFGSRLTMIMAIWNRIDILLKIPINHNKNIISRSCFTNDTPAYSPPSQAKSALCTFPLPNEWTLPPRSVSFACPPGIIQWVRRSGVLWVTTWATLTGVAASHRLMATNDFAVNGKEW